MACPQIITNCADFVPKQSVKELLDFFVTTGCVDIDARFCRMSAMAAQAVIKSKGTELSSLILQLLEAYFDAAEFKSEQIKTALDLLACLTDYFDKSMQKKSASTFDKLCQFLTESKKPVSDDVHKAACKCLTKLSRFHEDKAKKMFDSTFDALMTGKQESIARGQAFICAGIVKNFGLKFVVQKSLFQIIDKECFSSKKIENNKVIAGLHAIEAISHSLGKSIEPFMSSIV